MKYLVKLMIIALVSSTAYSQPTSIPEVTKREIITTLESYPVVLRELEVANVLLESQKAIIAHLNNQIKQHNALMDNKNLQIGNLHNQKYEYATEVKRLKKKNKLITILAIVVSITGIAL